MLHFYTVLPIWMKIKYEELLKEVPWIKLAFLKLLKFFLFCFYKCILTDIMKGMGVFQQKINSLCGISSVIIRGSNEEMPITSKEISPQSPHHPYQFQLSTIFF